MGLPKAGETRITRSGTTGAITFFSMQSGGFDRFWPLKLEIKPLKGIHWTTRPVDQSTRKVRQSQLFSSCAIFLQSSTSRYTCLLDVYTPTKKIRVNVQQTHTNAWAHLLQGIFHCSKQTQECFGNDWEIMGLCIKANNHQRYIIWAQTYGWKRCKLHP